MSGPTKPEAAQDLADAVSALAAGNPSIHSVKVHAGPGPVSLAYALEGGALSIWLGEGYNDRPREATCIEIEAGNSMWGLFTLPDSPLGLQL